MGTRKLTLDELNRLRQLIDQDIEDNLVPLDWVSMTFKLQLPYLSVKRKSEEIERVKHKGYAKLPSEIHGTEQLLVTMGLRADMPSIIKRGDPLLQELHTGGWLGLRVPLDILPKIFDYIGASVAISPTLKDQMLKNSAMLPFLRQHFENMRNGPFWTEANKRSLEMIDKYFLLNTAVEKKTKKDNQQQSVSCHLAVRNKEGKDKKHQSVMKNDGTPPREADSIPTTTLFGVETNISGNFFNSEAYALPSVLDLTEIDQLRRIWTQEHAREPEKNRKKVGRRMATGTMEKSLI
jgi:hypothetical protein